MTTGQDLAAAKRPTPSISRTWALLLLAGATLLALAGYILGTLNHGTHVVSGPVQVGDRVASMLVDGKPGPGVSGSIAWVEATGVMHDRGWPDCLTQRHDGSELIARFATVSVDYPDGTRADQVVYVDCR